MPYDTTISCIPESQESSKNRGWYAADRFPHRDAGFVKQFITYRLGDSVPEKVVERKKQELALLDEATLRNAFSSGAQGNAPGSGATRQASTTDRVAIARRRLLLKFVADYEDAGFGACHLRNPKIATIVVENLRYFDGMRYDLLEWCVMPNHVHVLIRQYTGFRLQDIVDSWKSYTAKQALKVLGKTGTFWMRGYFDHYIRDEEHMAKAREYIKQNPVKAGLSDTPEAWPWSSASERGRLGGEHVSVPVAPEPGAFP